MFQEILIKLGDCDTFTGMLGADGTVAAMTVTIVETGPSPTALTALT